MSPNLYLKDVASRWEQHSPYYGPNISQRVEPGVGKKVVLVVRKEREVFRLAQKALVLAFTVTSPKSVLRNRRLFANSSLEYTLVGAHALWENDAL